MIRNTTRRYSNYLMAWLTALTWALLPMQQTTAAPGDSSDCTTCIVTATPNAATATVDGLPGEWNTSPTGPDFWAGLYNAGRPDPAFPGYAHTGNSFVRYQCDPDNAQVTVYVLVLTTDQENYPVLVSAADAWAAIGGVHGKAYTGATGDDTVAPDFAWIGVGYDGDASHALGYEASFKLPVANSPWSCFVIHVEAFNKIANAAQTSGTQSFNGPGKCLSVVCPAASNSCQNMNATATATAVLCNGGDASVTVTASGGTAPYTGTGTFSVKAGVYNYTVTDANGCSATASVTITEPAKLAANATATTILCNGDDSTVTVSATGGASPYTGTGSFTVKAGTYSYTVTDANGCTDTTFVIVSQPSKLSATATATAILCNGDDSLVTVTATGGTAPYTGNGTFTVKAGTHNYTVTDANGCATTTSVTISEPSKLSATATATAILCNGGDSLVTVTAADGTAPYSGTGTFTVKAGTHNYTVTDANGCAATTSVTISEPSQVVATATATPILCNGGDSTVTVSATGGTGAYAGTGTFIVKAGTHTYAVSDANGCSSTVSINVTQPAQVFVTATATPILCFGGDSLVTVTATGGTAPYAGTGTFVVKAGSYAYTVSDANGCSAGAQIQITEPAPLQASVNNVEVCQGDLGRISATVTGGTGAYNFLWSNGATTPYIDVGLAGGYSVTVTDQNGCSVASGIGTLTYPTTRLFGSVFYDPNANGLQDGSEPPLSGIRITLSGNGINPVTTYTAPNGTYSFDGLLAGTYTVTELLPTGWIATTPVSMQVVVRCPTDPVLGISPFGSHTTTGIVGGHTLGFWSNKNGQSMLTPYDPAWRNGVNAMNLRNANGASYLVPSGSFSTAYTSFKNWLLGATASNMACMLSAQLAANVLDVAYNGLNPNALIVVAPGFRTQAGAQIIPALTGSPGFTVNPNTGSAYISVANLQALGKASLLVNGNTTAAGPVRTYQDCVKTLLDLINNNGSLGSGSTLTVVSPNPAAFASPY